MHRKPTELEAASARSMAMMRIACCTHSYYKLFKQAVASSKEALDSTGEAMSCSASVVKRRIRSTESFYKWLDLNGHTLRSLGADEDTVLSVWSSLRRISRS